MMDDALNQKRLLCIGGPSQTVKVINAAREMGIYTIVSDVDKNAPAARLADEFLACSVLDADGIIDYCRKHRVDGVLNYNIDIAQNTHEKVCREMGFPCFGSHETFESLTDKRIFKEKCRAFGLDTIPTYGETDCDIEFPVLVKPAESGGAIGMTICADEKALTAAIEAAKNRSRNGQCFIEKYMGACSDLHVVYFVVDGQPYLIRIADRYVGRVEDGLNRQCTCALQPSKYTQFYTKHLDEKMKAFIRYLGVENGPVSFQGFVDGDTIRWYDPAIRFPGGNYEAFFQRIFGIDLIRTTIKFALTGKIELSPALLEKTYGLDGFYTIQLDIDVGPGTISVIEGLEEIRNMPEVASIIQLRFLGDVVTRSGDVRQRLAEIAVFTNESAETIVQLIKTIQKTIRVFDENGNDMIVSPLDTDRLFN